MNSKIRANDALNPFDSDDWSTPQHPSARHARPASVPVGPPSTADGTSQLIGEELLKLSERIARLEATAARNDRNTAQLLTDIARAIENFSGSSSIPKKDVEARFVISGSSDSNVRSVKSLRRGFDESSIVEQPPAAKAPPPKMDESKVFDQVIAGEMPPLLVLPFDETKQETQAQPPAVSPPPDVDSPDSSEPDWSVWLQAWVRAEERADMLNEDLVPALSALIFTPGRGQDVFDAWRALFAGRELLIEAKVADIKDEQIQTLIDSTLQRYERELNVMRKKSTWLKEFQRLSDSIKALSLIMQADTLDTVIKAQDGVEEWFEYMDREANWFVDDSGFQEKFALTLALLHDKMCDRPGWRQSQFAIESKADMVAYNALRTLESFLARMNVLRDKELAIGKPHDQLGNPKLRDQHKKGTNISAQKPPTGLKVSRILRNRWVLMGPGNRELKDLVKPSYELE